MSEELHTLFTKLLASPRENEYIEFKVSNHEKDEIGKRLSALANGAALLGQQFGYLVFGVEDQTHQVTGTSFKPSFNKVGNEELENWLAQRLNPRIDFRISEFEYQSKNVVLFHIPAAAGQPVTFQHVGYIRIGSITRSLKDFPEKERKLWQRPAADFEREPAKRNLTQAEVIALLDIQAIFDLMLKIPYPATQEGVIAKLLTEKLIVQNNGHYHITNLGAMLFAKDISQFDTVSRKAIRVVKYDGKSKIKTFIDQSGKFGYAFAFDRLMVYISGLLPSNELIVNARREDVTMYPPLALRELISNALIHQDFRVHGAGPLIEIFDDRIEISNPGKPMVSPERFIDEFQSRNEIFASAMRRIGYCEEKGSGIDKVIFWVEMWQLPAPDFQIKETHTKVILYAHKDFNSMDKNDKVRACYQHCALLYVNNDRMTNQTLRDRFGIKEQNYSIASRIIRDALDEGVIKIENPENKSKKYMSYIPFWA